MLYTLNRNHQQRKSPFLFISQADASSTIEANTIAQITNAKTKNDFIVFFFLKKCDLNLFSFSFFTIFFIYVN